MATTCDVAECGQSATQKLVGFDVCERCIKATEMHLLRWLQDPDAQQAIRAEMKEKEEQAAKQLLAEQQEAIKKIKEDEIKRRSDLDNDAKTTARLKVEK